MKLLLILLTNLLTRIHIVGGDGCWVSTVCDGEPRWRKITPCDYETQAKAVKNQCTTELQAIRDETDSILNEVDHINERIKLLNSRPAPETTIDEVKATTDGAATTDVTATTFDETTDETTDEVIDETIDKTIDETTDETTDEATQTAKMEITGSDETTCDSTTTWKQLLLSMYQTPARQSTEVTTDAEETEDTSDIHGTPKGESKTTLVDDASEVTTQTTGMPTTAKEFEATTGSTELKTVFIADTTLEHTAKYTDVETTVNEVKATTDSVATTDVTSTTFDETTLEVATQTTIVETTAIHAECSGVVYDGKCYWVEVHSSVDTNFAQAQQICNDKNSKLADIYSKDHYDQIMNYLRKHIIDGYSAHVWTGMRKKVQNENAFLSNGSQAPYTKPSSYSWAWDEADESYTHVYIMARPSLTSTGQGMAGGDPNGIVDGALCQTQ